MKSGYVYILSSKRNGALYIGVTSNLVQRIWQHKNHSVEGFTATHEVTQLVYFEQYEDINNALAREKQLKNWTRKWKQDLIEKENPYWRDLYESILE